MLLLLKTFVEIIALRKGPEAVPSSFIVLGIAIVLMVISSTAAVALVGIRADHNFVLTFISYGFGIAFYAAIIFVAGHAQRLLSAISSIIACGSLITLLFTVELLLLEPVLGRDVAGLLATLIIFWSVPVEGHIIASTIERHWFLGIAIAMIAFIMQYGLQIVFAA